MFLFILFLFLAKSNLASKSEMKEKKVKKGNSILFSFFLNKIFLFKYCNYLST